MTVSNKGILWLIKLVTTKIYEGIKQSILSLRKLAAPDVYDNNKTKVNL